MVAVDDTDVVADDEAVVLAVDVTVVDGVVSLHSVKLPCRYPLMAEFRWSTVGSHREPLKAVLRWPPISHDTVPANESGKLIRSVMRFKVAATSRQAFPSVDTSMVSISWPLIVLHSTGLLLWAGLHVSSSVLTKSAWCRHSIASMYKIPSISRHRSSPNRVLVAVVVAVVDIEVLAVVVAVVVTDTEVAVEVAVVVIVVWSQPR